ncbi:hypothetical protein A9Q78_01100 [Methylophaga sp. 41_12_T18]|nr:hypothetical protein A9Q78_01100 [Methylophaga sp. 41_12_T18]
MLRNLFVVFITLFSNAVFAHAGHDHGHWISGWTHAFLLLSFIGVIAVGIQVTRHKQLNQENK